MNFLQLKQKWGAFSVYAFLAAGLALTLTLGFWLGNQYFSVQQKAVLTLEHTVQNLQSENNELSKNLNILRVELDVAALSQQKTFAEIKQSIEREKALQKDIAFYQQVMAPELTQQGFVIDAFNVEKTLSERVYRFEIVMMQREKIKNTLKGNLDITLVGSESGVSKKYSLKSLLVNPDLTLAFGFKYFQVLDGQILLPEQFQPERILVQSEIYQFNRKKGELHSSFDWILSSTNTTSSE
ncbi:DUF6776 family protein [Paraglaciecola sp.]|uniref:DUF6776 family protein n=1 Tax=Paraglaciecola sp. TaxID=1920173 RepID=UPI0030F3E2DD